MTARTRRKALALSFFTVGYNLAEGVVAMIGAALGEKQEAILLLEELLAEDVLTFPEMPEAEALMKKLRG